MSKVIMTTMTFIIFSTIVFAEEITPLQLLEKYKANRELLKNHITKSEELTEVRDTAYGDKPEWTRIVSEFRTDSKRIDLTTKRWRDISSPSDQGLHKKPDLRRVIWDGESWIEFLPNNKWAFISKREQHKNDYVPLGYNGSSLDGIFLGDSEPVENILAKASNINLRLQMEKVNGTDCYIIDANTTSGKYSLWIDPEHGYNIAKVNIYKSGDDILYGKPISQQKIPEEIPTVGKFKFPGKTEDFTFSLDKVEFRKVGEGWVPVEAEYQYTTEYVDGRVITEKKNHKRTEITPDPNFSAVGAFVPDIPDGTRVTIEDVVGIGYHWLNGKPVANIDEYFFEQLGDAAKQIEREAKSEVAEATNKKAEISNKEAPAVNNIQVETIDAERKVPSEFSSFSVFALILAVVFIIGVIGWLMFRLVKGDNHAKL